VVVVIPARAGSEGIPSKNVRAVGGIPLVGRAIRAALGSVADRVVVSTDGDEIADVARRFGAEVVSRPAALATAEATSESALLHALDSLAAASGRDPDICVLVQCTSAFIEPSDIDGVVAAVASGGADCAFTATAHHGFLWRSGPDGAVPVNHEAGGRLRRQDLPPEHLETGAAYAMRVDGFRVAQHRFFGRIGVHLVPAVRSLEIDEPWQLEVAEALAAGSMRTGARPPAGVKALILDFDGVVTDNRVLTLQDGQEAVLSDRGDGMGIERLREAGLRIVVLSKERNPVVAARCAKLAVEVVQGLDDKVGALGRWLADNTLEPSEVVFVGNDLNDVECMRHVGFAVAVADAHPSALAVADLVLRRPGGRGAIRELADLLIEDLQGHHR
jgi:YrbI family 3-deoxy-D-manno-octulosonate 8-phosphate phosphatase